MLVAKSKEWNNLNSDLLAMKTPSENVSLLQDTVPHQILQVEKVIKQRN